MPRRLTLRNTFAAIAMAVVALWGGGKATIDHTAAPLVASAEQNRAVLRAAMESSRAEVTARTPINESSAADTDRATLVSTRAFPYIRVSPRRPNLEGQIAVRVGLYLRPPPRAPPLTG